jgi:hypothetical protein
LEDADLNVPELVAAIEARGARLHLDGAWIDVEGEGDVPKELLDALAREKVAAIAFLRNCAIPQASVHVTDTRLDPNTPPAPAAREVVMHEDGATPPLQPNEVCPHRNHSAARCPHPSRPNVVLSRRPLSEYEIFKARGGWQAYVR